MASSDLYAPNDMIYIVCKQSVYIKELRMSGPIIAPIKVKMQTAYQIVCRGIKLYQYNPATKEFVLMTVQNAFRKDKFKDTTGTGGDTSFAKVAAVNTMSLAEDAPVETAVEKAEVKEPVEVAEPEAVETTEASEAVTEPEAVEVSVEEVKTSKKNKKKNS